MQSSLHQRETIGIRLQQLARAAFLERREAGLALTHEAAAIARACRAMASNFQSGARLFTFGNGRSSSDAAHIAVEFVHPVLVGKRALPAISLSNDTAALTGVASRKGWDHVFSYQLQKLARPGDIALGLVAGPRCRNVLLALEAAADLGMLTLALATSTAEAIADHVLRVDSTDPAIVKEVRVTLYHILWELVHVFLEQPQYLEPGT